MKKLIFVLCFVLAVVSFKVCAGQSSTSDYAITVSSSTAYCVLRGGNFVKLIEIYNNGSYDVYKGTSSAVTTSNGFPIPTGCSLIYKDWDEPIYIKSITGAGSVRVDLQDETTR